ncbi:uncharacterized protein BDV17DRAFT_113645 [Aspergillus undulatus]|uniref:uncharacterized protein n=1 Tax=Aspergillus undulatus TaxID=1810928 RepID=UPI003CCDCE80
MAGLCGTPSHESAHTFGANHDCDSNTCSANLYSPGDCCPLSSSICDDEEQYLMNTIASRALTRFSACTINTVCSRIGHGDVDTRRLVSPADIDDLEGGVSLPAGQCGNGIVETGEACDCGRDSCDESGRGCCDPLTCQWRDGGRCALAQENEGNGTGFQLWVGAHRSLLSACALAWGPRLYFWWRS